MWKVWTEGSCLDLELSLALRIDEKLDHAVQSEVRVLNHLPLVVKGRILADGELIYSRDEMQADRVRDASPEGLF